MQSIDDRLYRRKKNNALELFKYVINASVLQYKNYVSQSLWFLHHSVGDFSLKIVRNIKFINKLRDIYWNNSKCNEIADINLFIMKMCCHQWFRREN